MRVNVSYSVDFTEVLSELKSLYTREREKLAEQLLTIEHSLSQPYTDKNLSEVVLAVEEYRKVINNFDIKLAEMANILDGYVKIKEQLRKVPQEHQSSAAE